MLEFCSTKLSTLSPYLTYNAYTHTRLTALCPGLPRRAGTRKVKTIWILLKQETLSGSGISWAICKSAPRSRQITTPAPHCSVFYRPDALPAAQQQCQSTEGDSFRRYSLTKIRCRFSQQKIGCHDNVPWGSKKKLRIVHLRKSSATPANFVKIGLVEVEKICLKEITKNIFLNTSETYRPPLASLKPCGQINGRCS